MAMLTGLFGHYSTTIIWLTIFCAIPPVVQSFILLIVKIRHPKVESRGETEQLLDETSDQFAKMAHNLLVYEFPVKSKHNAKIKEWLQIDTINANNYRQEDKVTSDIEKNDGRLAETIPFDAIGILQDAQNRQDEAAKTYVTPMMKIINYHVRIISITSRLEQLNLGMKISDSTTLSRGHLPWRGVIGVLMTLEQSPIFPSVLKYSVVRALKDIEGWSYAEKGTRLDPQTLSEKPWPGLKSTACFYIDSFLLDKWLHWLQIYFATVVVGIILKT